MYFGIFMTLWKVVLKLSPVVTYIGLLNFAMHRTHLLQMGWVRLRLSLAKGRWYQELIIIPNYLSSCLPLQSLKILSLCLIPGLVWPHLVQLTKAELLLKCHSHSTWKQTRSLECRLSCISHTTSSTQCFASWSNITKYVRLWRLAVFRLIRESLYQTEYLTLILWRIP